MIDMEFEAQTTIKTYAQTATLWQTIPYVTSWTPSCGRPSHLRLKLLRSPTVASIMARSMARSSNARSTRTRVVSYAESSNDEYDFDDFHDPDSEPELRSTRKRRRVAEDVAPIPIPKPSATSDSKHSNSSKSKKHSNPRTRRSTAKFPIARRWRTERPDAQQEASPQRHIPSDGIVPAWETLPYAVLYSIFDHSSQPRDQTARTWLLRTATVCKAFAEPALAALYRNPFFTSHVDPHQFLSTLQRDQSSTLIDYAVKVRSLEVEADLLSHAVTGVGLINLSELAGACPQLQTLRITELSDQPPFRSSPSSGKLLHPDNFLSGFEKRGVRLKRWRWNSNLMVVGERSTVNELIRSAHGSPVFENVEHLELARLVIEEGFVSPKKNRASGEDFVSLPALLRPLKKLQSLSLESCIGEDWDFLTRLPQSIRHLRIINNGYLSSADLEAFLETHGSTLITLDLSHNHYLDLAFTARLRSLCPDLRYLKMDATYYSAVALDKDDKPLYDELLPPGMAPTWPKSLRRLELLHLRKWEKSSAELFFGSLQAAADELPNLRSLIVRAMLSISWRDRAQFREKYIQGMRRIFKRRSKPPAPELASFRCYQLFTGRELAKRGGVSNHDVGSAVTSNAEEVKTETSSRRSQRLTIKQRQEAEQDTSEDNGDDSAGPTQGLCDTVEIGIDNLRPAENQFREQDFLDSERSGDEDWTEGVEYADEPTYAW